MIKDLSKLGRDLNKTIMIDNMPENFKLQPNNGLWIKTWNEDIKDLELLHLEKLLKDIITLEPQDIRVCVKKIKDEVAKRRGKPFPYHGIDI